MKRQKLFWLCLIKYYLKEIRKTRYAMRRKYFLPFKNIPTTTTCVAFIFSFDNLTDFMTKFCIGAFYLSYFLASSEWQECFKYSRFNIVEVNQLICETLYMHRVAIISIMENNTRENLWLVKYCRKNLRFLSNYK